MIRYSYIYYIISIFCVCAFSIRILVKPEIFDRYWPYTTDVNFSRDWSDECDIPCLWTANTDNIDGVFYFIKNGKEARQAFEDKKIVPISIGGSTEAMHYYPELNNEMFRKYFNASALLTVGSDIPWLTKISSYVQMQQVKQIQNPIRRSVIANINCASRNNRENIVQEMSEIIPIDRIGNCLRNKPWPFCGEQACTKEEALRKYMFCLAFENGDIPGYVTEKIHDCFRAGSLPVYYGTEYVANLVPQGSYIDMRDFESHKLLAEYMVTVMNNATLYDRYFEWKYHPLDPDFIERNKPFWDYKVQCRVCRYVWVIQRGLTWDKFKQNSTRIMNITYGQKDSPSVQYVRNKLVLILNEENTFSKTEGLISRLFMYFFFVLVFSLFLYVRMMFRTSVQLKYAWKRAFSV